MKIKHVLTAEGGPGKIPLRYWFFVAVVLGLGLLPMLAAGSRAATPATWQKGVSIVKYGGSPDEIATATGFDSIDRAKASNANIVTFIINFNQTITDTSVITTERAPSDTALRTSIRKARSVGLDVTLKPHIDVNTGEWRAFINPQGSERAAWYANYTALLMKYARLGQQEGVYQLILGTELVSMAAVGGTEDPNNTTRWKEIIAQVRSVFSGKLTYSANWGDNSNFSTEFNRIGFWSDLDYIGISAYFPLSWSGEYPNNPDLNFPTYQLMLSRWDNTPRKMIEPYQKTINKPVLFTEVGYRSVDRAAAQPFEYSPGGTYDINEQMVLIQALLDYWKNYPWFAGVHYWLWNPNNYCCASPDTGFEVQGKPSEQTLRDGYAATAPAPSPIFSLESATVSPLAAESGSKFSPQVTLRVNNFSGSVTVQVKIKIYDPANNLVNQQTSPNLTFSAGQSQTAAFDWQTATGQTLGQYTVSVQVVEAANPATIYLSSANAANFKIANCAIVTTNSDANLCGTFRYALGIVRNNASRTITFTLGSPYTINLTSPLPAGTLNGVRINDLPGYCAGGPLIVLNATGAALGSVVEAKQSNIKGLQLVGMQLKTDLGLSRFQCVKVVRAPGPAPAPLLAPDQNPDPQEAVKTYRVVAVDYPASFRSNSRYAVEPGAGRKLVAVTIEYSRDFMDHLLSSANGEIYLKESSGSRTYATVGATFPPGEAGKPLRLVTFVFEVEAGAGPLEFYYGSQPVLKL